MKIFFSSVIILLINANLFGQNLNDLIITKNQDSIRCKITLVNDINIFYQYKKKKNIKTDYISRELVLDFQGENIENITISKKDVKMYDKCDTCTNWIVNQNDDTIYHNLIVRYLKMDSTLIKTISWKDLTTSILYKSSDFKSVYWNGVNYFPITPDYRYDYSDLIYNSDVFLGYYLIKNKASLIRYTSAYQFGTILPPSQRFKSYKLYHKRTKFTPKNTILDHLVIDQKSILYKPIKYTPEYCIEIDSQTIKIPIRNRRKHFRIAMMEVLHKDKKLVERIKNKEFEYEDIEKIINIYNQNIE
jgi:hypothetical protein